MPLHKLTIRSVPNRPRSGLAWNEEAVKRYRYDV